MTYFLDKVNIFAKFTDSILCGNRVMAGLKNLAADRRQGGDNVHAVDQPSSVKSRQFKLS